MSINRDELSIYSAYRSILITEAQDQPVNPKDPKSSMDPLKFKEFERKLTRAKFVLYRDSPFFGLTLQKLKTVPTLEFDTMAVDNNRNIFINPDFTLSMSDAEVVGVLAHETMHIMTETFFRQKGRDMEMWNWATDYIMNRMLLEDNFVLPKLGLLPVNKGGRWIVEIKGLPKIDITDMTAEKLYDELNKNQQKLQPMRGMLSELQKQLDQHLTDQQSDQVKPMEGNSDNPVYQKNGSGGKTESQKKSENKALVQDALQKAKEMCKTRGDNGGIPRGFAENFYKPTVNWKQLLRNFIIGATTIKTDWARPSRRYAGGDFFIPKKTYVKNELNAVIAIDTSGSISDQVMGTFLGEILSIIKTYRTQKVKFSILLWHTEVYQEVDIDSSRMSIADITNKLKNVKAEGGGTTISCIKSYLDKTKPNQKIKGGLLVFTDGEVERNPILPNAPRKLFLITEDGTTEILKKFGPTYVVNVGHA
jgi:predicted metal-dependent peptidase